MLIRESIGHAWCRTISFRNSFLSAWFCPLYSLQCFFPYIEKSVGPVSPAQNFRLMSLCITMCVGVRMEHWAATETPF